MGDDLTSHVLAKEDWKIVRFPAIVEDDETHAIETELGRQSFTRRCGEALHPESQPLATLQMIRRSPGLSRGSANTSRHFIPGATAQMLDWFKRGSGPGSNAEIWQLYKKRHEARQAAASQPAKLLPLSRLLPYLRW